MADLKVCDKCQAIITIEKTNYIYYRNNSYTKDGHLDLCFDCYNSFQDWTGLEKGTIVIKKKHWWNIL